MEYTFTVANFEEEVLNSPLPVLVDFYADWCNPCKMMAPTVAKLAEAYEGKVKVGKINVDENGNITSMTVIKMELGEPDASGRRRPIVKEGSEFVLDVDTMIMALGTSPNPLIRSTTPGLDADKHGCLITNGPDGLTSRPMVYAGGDAVTGAATVILAMGAGKEAARAIDAAIQAGKPC